MKIIASFFAVLLMAASPVLAQDDLPVDESLIVLIRKVPTGGYLSRTEIPKVVQLDITEKGAEIMDFVYKYSKGDEKVEIVNQGAELSDEIKNHMKTLKIGSKISFENIRVSNASGEVLTRPLKITIKS